MADNKPKAAVVTHGCRYNQFESAEISQHLTENGFHMVPDSQMADLYVINTCTVTGKSEYKSRQSIRKMSNRNKDAAIVVTGCYSQMNPTEILERTDANLVVGNVEKHSLSEYLGKAGLLKEGVVRKHEGPSQVFVEGISKTPAFQSTPIHRISGRTKAFLKIQSGCNESCSFCVVTIARGDSVSEEPGNVVRQCRTLVKNGSKEITLTGIHLGSYGRDLKTKTSLYELLKLLIELEGDFRIRLSSIDPVDIDAPLISLMRESSKICNYLHLPLQSGDDFILSEMRRNYTSSHYQNTFRSIASRVEGVGIGADVMVGFPGETEERFQNTFRLIQELPFAYLHVFNYSQRPGTDAANLPDQVPNAIRKERAERLKELGWEKSVEFRRRFLETTLEILVEGKRDRETGLLKGHTGNYIPVLLEDGDEMMNSLVKVRLARMEGLKVFGEAQSVESKA